MVSLDKIVLDMMGKPLGTVRLVIWWMVWVGVMHFDINIISKYPSRKPEAYLS
jgi:hypothetical protein